MNAAIADLRQDYQRAALLETDVAANPIEQFQMWFDQAVAAQLPEPNAMTVASATPEGIPSARIVLLKGCDQRGFVFFTNYNSHKGQELTINPHAAIVFLWTELERQVRIQGTVEKIAAAESDEYFYSRPAGSRMGAWASEQSCVIPDRTVLDDRLAALKVEYANKDVPRPEHWGGFRVKPRVIEFWQGRSSRLHDRLRYQLDGAGNWCIDRLAP
ncbi:pyridoxamine 5'-phosphate oxidase [filamentous cyanobacterium LEGE 11480]|uniref:Pyridoxine/pyridoxamine 5'-phosphate oxidase n=1 Tax=Romeriopsis navalis LEGE 11480 TaxID=2777977 RepID=A0A928Z1M3_9CYAN|nr:pyridoxamine 5'-phosphate oxidase [Romeriopsis navalis LEGE 11480]